MGILTSAQKATQCPFLGIGHKMEFSYLRFFCSTEKQVDVGRLPQNDHNINPAHKCISTKRSAHVPVCVCVCKHVESCCCPCGLHNLGGAETLRWIYPICIFVALSKSRFIVDKDCVTRCTRTKTEVMERTAKTHRTHSKKTLSSSHVYSSG